MIGAPLVSESWDKFNPIKIMIPEAFSNSLMYSSIDPDHLIDQYAQPDVLQRLCCEMGCNREDREVRRMNNLRVT